MAGPVLSSLDQVLALLFVVESASWVFTRYDDLTPRSDHAIPMVYCRGSILNHPY